MSGGKGEPNGAAGPAKDRLDDLRAAPLGRLVVRYSWPALVSMALNVLYSVVDRFYIGQGCGQDALAGLTLATPVLMLLAAVGVWIGVGHSSVISIRLGEGNRAAAEEALGELVALKIGVFLLLTPLLWVFLDPVLRLTGGANVTPGALAAARRYLAIVLGANLFSHLAFGLSAAMRAEGAAVRSMTCMVVGFGVNLLLDPLFIFAFGLGVSGAAWATVAAMAASCACALSFYARGRSAVRLAWRRVRIYPRLFAKAAAVGLAPFLQQFMNAVINFVMPVALAGLAATAADATREIASLGVFQIAVLLFVMPALGLQQGAAPIIGYNWGARNHARVLRTLGIAYALTTLVVTAASVVQVFWPEAIARCFTDGGDPAFTACAARNLRVANCLFWCIGLNVVATTYFQAIGRPAAAIVLSLLRQGACLLPCIWLLPRAFPEDPALGVWLAHPVSDFLAFLATIPPAVLHLRFLHRASRRTGTVRRG